MDSSTISSFFSSPPDLDAFRLARLSAHLELLLDPVFLDRADAEIVLATGGRAVVGLYSCILAARSPFFHRHFSPFPAAGEKIRLDLAELVPGGRHIGREALVVVLRYLHTARLELPPQECLDDVCAHRVCRPAIDFVVECMYAASGFQISELVSLFQRRLSDFVNIDLCEDIIPIIHVASTCQLPDLLNQCIQRVAISTLDNKYLENKLPSHAYCTIKEIRHSTLLDEFILDPEHEKRVSNIRKALDSDDVDLVCRLLNEAAITLDDAFALHYAAGYCEPKVLAELLKLDSANVNLKNNRGYTPLHMACMRQEPNIILLLVERGASVLERTPDGRNALTICKRLTRGKDYNRKLEKCQKRSKAYLCIDILEQGLKRKSFTLDSVSIEEKIIAPLLVDNFHMKLLNLEIRVSCAKLFFPSEAMLAMCIAEADSTEEFTGTNLSKLKVVGLNEIPTVQNRNLVERLDALTKTAVALGRWYFPNCSNVLDKFLDEESTDLAFLESGTPEDRRIKRRRFFELKEEVRKAFDKDMAASADIASTASSPSSPRDVGRGKRPKAYRKRKQTQRLQLFKCSLFSTHGLQKGGARGWFGGCCGCDYVSLL